MQVYKVVLRVTPPSKRHLSEVSEDHESEVGSSPTTEEEEVTEQEAYKENGEKQLAGGNQEPRTEKNAFGPGFINASTDKGESYSSCLALEFADANEMNDWFKAHPFGYLAVQTMVRGTRIFVLTHQVMDAEKQEELAQANLYFAEWAEKQNELKAKARASEEEARIKGEKERAELLDLGKRCKEDHQNILALEAENKKLRRKANRK